MAWQSILGHDHWITIFDHVVNRKRLAHAYLFCGPDGVGKRRFALELARALLCEEPTPGRLSACDKCASCLLMNAGTHPDFFLVNRPEEKNELPVEVMRELGANFNLKTARGRGKIAVIDDADDLNEEGANCFLKTLEEPPPGSLFFLVCRSLEKQLPTIRSRCQIVRFSPLKHDLVANILRGRGIDAALIPKVVRLAAGSPGQAFQLADGELWSFRQKLLEGLAQPKVDTVAIAKQFTEFVEDAGKETSLHRRRARLTIRLLMEGLNEALRMRLGPGPTMAEGAELQLLKALAQRADPEKLLALLERCLEMQVALDRYVQVGLVLEGLMEGLTQVLERAA